MKVAFLTSGHLASDDRIYYHQGLTLARHEHNVLIISSKEDVKDIKENISIDSFNGDSLLKREKIIAFRQRLESFRPDIVICSEPLPIVAAKEYRLCHRKELKIFYDITEWYPSKRFLGEYHPATRWLGFLKLLFFNIYASLIADAFIFGDWYKSKPYRFLFPFTPYRINSYYPDLKYISYKNPSLTGNRLRLSYSGEISIEKGFGNFLKVVYGLSDYNKDLELEIKLLAWYPSENDRKECERLIRSERKNITFLFREKENLTGFSGVINDTDIFLDLRKVSFITNHSLPIKLFYYAALGRPVIFTDLKAIRRDIEIENFGFLVDPEDTEEIIRLISDYLKDRDLYLAHCDNARKLFLENYNWGKIAPGFLEFIESA